MTLAPPPLSAAGPAPLDTTPPPAVTRRRLVFAGLVGLTIGLAFALMVATLSPGGIGLVDLGMLACFALTLPWSAIGFWNAVIGLGLMRLSADPEAAAAPIASRSTGTEPITARVAILVCIRNEGTERLARNLQAMLAGVIATGTAGRFHCFLLSDTSRPEIAAEEEALAADLDARYGATLPVTYRRRSLNTGFKAGNIRDFCERWGAAHDLAIVLDADSFMSPQAMLRLVRLMQAEPKLGILQSLIVGMPSVSPFTRLFQFGMRLGMRSYTLGSAFWQAECGPYWGHNAVLRLAPFIAHCDLPTLPSGRVILSHDQVEAVLMRRAGYEVRVLPVEFESWEENPPTLLEFIRRDLRWCQGNMQYVHLLGLPGLKWVSRFQLLLGILMFIGSPAWLSFVFLASIAGAVTDGPVYDPGPAALVLWLVLGMTFAPKLASLADLLVRRSGRASFGGSIRILAGAVSEVVFFMILAPIMAVTHTVFLAGLPFGRTIGWSAQARDQHAVPLRDAAERVWPHTLIGLAGLVWIALTAPQVLPYALPFYGPLALAIPFTMLSAWPPLGVRLARIGLGRVPEEAEPPAVLGPLALPAILAAGRTAAGGASGTGTPADAADPRPERVLEPASGG